MRKLVIERTAGWFYKMEGEPRGPLSWAELLALRANDVIDRSFFLWREGMLEWKTMGAVIVMAELFESGSETSMSFQNWGLEAAIPRATTVRVVRGRAFEAPRQDWKDDATLGWFYGQGFEQTGPFSLAELLALRSNGVIEKSALLWRTGMPEWKEWGYVMADLGFGPSGPWLFGAEWGTGGGI